MYIHDMVRLTEALDKMLHLATLVGTDLTRFERESGLTTSRTHLLWVLGAAGPSTQQSLASALGVSARNVTGLVDGLVASGHVTREPHPTDRRATWVTPTARGEAAIRELKDSHEHLARELFGHLPAEQLTVFAATLDETIATFSRLMEERS
ncbi:MAG: Transcriptional regulator, MarR family [uncultured Nocardioidaceae bacterium]|uniref:Transcriptional regulator, MarR family n=1 Tax=uncultured Nocardioidaceae bacterium TaxID=253824 RepID=A0A6J4MSD4_9ACTN|nr:MAG: Transcriptional regulator, MarR family [uncultured Nocardioidaceae bacterium]